MWQYDLNTLLMFDTYFDTLVDYRKYKLKYDGMTLIL